MERNEYLSDFAMGCVAIACICISWYFLRSNKREQEAHDITKVNTQYFMDKAKVHDMEQRFE